ncbi:MAG: hypothetical protein ACRYFX_21750 [Janthinobacterium lividum]
MRTLLQQPVPQPTAAISPPLAINLDTADMKLLAYSLMRPPGQPQPQLLVDCRALARQRTLGVCDVLSRLLQLRQTGANIVLLHVGPELRRSLRLLQLESLFSLVE